MRTVLMVLALAAVIGPTPAAAQEDALLNRWVGTYRGRTLQLEFYGDTMLVVDDRYALDYRLARDSIVAVGDTTIVARWRIVLGRLLLETPEADVITMARQDLIGRPVTGQWLSDGPVTGTERGELILDDSRVCRFRAGRQDAWKVGEWEREVRMIHFVWADSTEWRAQYDPVGNNLLFDETENGGVSGVFRRVFRR